MRFLMAISFSLCLPLWLFAGSGTEGYLDHVILKISSVSTNATKSQAESTVIEKGCIKRVDFKFAHTTNTPWVTMFSSNAFTGKIQSIQDNKVLATNFSLYPKIDYQHTSGSTIGTNAAMGDIISFNEKIYLIATNGTVGIAAQVITADVIYECK